MGRCGLRESEVTYPSDSNLVPDDGDIWLFEVQENNAKGGSKTTRDAWMPDVVVLCWLGFDLADEEPTWRVEQAIKRALYTCGEDGEVNLHVTRQALSPAATSLDRFHRHGPNKLDTFGTLERLWANTAIGSYKLYDVTREQLGGDLAVPPAEVVIERLAYRAQARRFPATQLMEVSVDEDSEES